MVMRLQGFLTAGFAFAAVAATLPRPGVCGSTDAVFIESTPPPAASAGRYESDYVAELRKHGVGENTPEADARPGEAYFLRATQAFRKGDFTFAIQMYQVAASWAYKPAEYNLGVMYARGQGVPVDLPRAMAWMALAAERNDKHYVDARETVYASLTKEQFDQANTIWRELKQTYGDEVALRRAKARWAEVKANMTGSRVGSVGNLSVGVPSANGGDPSSQKPGNAAMAAKLAAQGVSVVRSTASSAAEATGGSGIDGSIAYRQLRESDNPYDPKFKNGTIGTATVGPPTTVQTGASSDATADKPDPAKSDQ
jgi:hypothetical protein